MVYFLEVKKVCPKRAASTLKNHVLQMVSGLCPRCFIPVNEPETSSDRSNSQSLSLDKVVKDLKLESTKGYSF